MGMFGKIFGGVIGFTIGGPLGALAGAALGHNFIDGNKKGPSFKNSAMRKQQVFFITVFACLGKVAKADGNITEDEVDVLKKYLRENLGADARTANYAVQLFFSSANSNTTYEQYATQFYETFKSDRNIVLMLMEVQMKIAMADGMYHENERAIIEKAKIIFGISDAEFKRLESIHLKSATSNYDILNSKPSDSDDVIKKNYRQLLKEYHPDRLASKGLSDEFMAIAREKFDNIQNAYDGIRKERNF